jgi:hypothetical protein
MLLCFVTQAMTVYSIVPYGFHYLLLPLFSAQNNFPERIFCRKEPENVSCRRILQQKSSANANRKAAFNNNAPLECSDIPHFKPSLHYG